MIPAEQQKEFQQIVKTKPPGILLSAADASLLKGDIDAAIAAGIPVVTVDSDSPGSKRLFFVGTNNYEAGRMGGRRLAELLKGKGNVVVFTMPGQANLEERLKGYKDALSDHAGIKITDVIDFKGDPRVAFDSTQEILGKAEGQGRRVRLPGSIGRPGSSGGSQPGQGHRQDHHCLRYQRRDRQVDSAGLDRGDHRAEAVDHVLRRLTDAGPDSSQSA